MMKFTYLVPLLIFSFWGKAQYKTFTMKDAVVNQYGSLAPERFNQIGWVANSNHYYTVNKYNDSYILSLSSIDDKAAKTITLKELSSKFQSLTGKSLSRFPHLNFLSTEVFQFEKNQNVYNYNLLDNKLIHSDSLEILAGAANRDKSSAGYIAYTIANNLYIHKDDSSKEISHNDNRHIVSGQTVSRSEFGIHKGTFWSPDGKKLAYYVKNESKVANYPIVNWNKIPAKVDFIKYPMAGTANTESLELKVYNSETETTTTIKTGLPNTQYLTNIAWGPKSEYVYVVHLNRQQNHLELKSYDAESGELVRLLFEEKSDKYVEPLNPIRFVKSQDNLFVWESARSGNNHLYLYNTKGKLQSQLTSGNWEVISFNGFDPEGNKAYFTATKESPLNRDLYSVTLKKAKLKKVTKNDGTHSTILSNDRSLAIDKFSNTETPRVTSIITTSGEVKRELLNSTNPLEDYKLGRMRLFSLKDNDNQDLYCRMYYPTDFDSTKKYPVVVYLYGGPHAQMVRNTWGGGGNLWYQYMAQQGYIVWTLDNKGSGNRGIAWEQSTFHNLGETEMEDQLTGINFLKSKEYVDAERIGIHGWSYGGFMAMSLMTRHPGVFKACVAGGPVIDWSLYEVMYTEGMMGTPISNPKGYNKSNLLNYIQDLEGKMLIIHGTSDPVVVWQHTQLYLKKAVELGTQVDYFVYPMHEHNVRGRERTHLMQKVTNYFNDFL